MTQPKQRGGKRAGAGSPRKYKVETVKMQVPITILDKVIKLAEPYLNKKNI